MVYDCFTFFNELDLLEIRLNELDKVVDKFVLVEATRTFQGKEKPLYFRKNKDKFSKFLHKIIHVVVDDFTAMENESAWIYESYQRNKIMDGLHECDENDVIIISDIDELPVSESITQHKKSRGIKIFRQRMFYYYLNCINSNMDGSRYHWHGPIMLNYSPDIKPQDIRALGMALMTQYSNLNLKKQLNFYWWKFRNIFLKGRTIYYVDKGGWHFSYLGGVEKIVQKLEAFAHTEYNTSEYKDPEKIKAAIESGKDIFGRNYSYRFIPLDDSFPKYIVDNSDKFKSLLSIK